MVTINCEFCGESVNTSSPQSYKRVLGWIPNKGPAAPVLASTPQGWAHYSCVETQKKFPVDAASTPMF